ncbi:MAG: molybdopterin-dependent oxidoreductase, partial [Candidatus Rokuibacteriota bacterium]
FLLRADRSPNARGAELIGLGGDAANVLAAARGGQLRHLLVFQHDLFESAWPAADVRDALTRTETVVYAGTNANATSALARWVLPSAAWVERDGTFTNFEGRVQRFRQACEPLGAARPDWEWLGRLLAVLGGAPAGERAEHWFRARAASVPAFAGMSYRTLGDAGGLVAGARSTGAPVPPGGRAPVTA